MGQTKKYAGAERLESGKWRKRFTLAGKRYTVYGSTRKEAEEAAYERRKEIETGEYKKNNSITLNEYFREWLERRAGNLSKSAAFTYETVYKNHVSRTATGRRKMQDIERRELMTLKAKIAGKGVANTANRVIVLLHAVFKAAVLDEILAKNPADNIPRIKVQKKESVRETIHRALTREEIDLFLWAIEGTWYRNAFRLMLVTGIRAGECAALEWADVDYKKGVLHIRRTVTRDRIGKRIIGDTTKTKASRRDIFLSPDMREILADQRQFFKDLHSARVVSMHGRIFEDSRGGIPTASMFNQAIRQAIKKIRERKGETVQDFTVHALRDTFATLALMQNVRPNTLKELLGHTSLAMTMDLYGHVLDSEKKEVMESLHILKEAE